MMPTTLKLTVYFLFLLPSLLFPFSPPANPTPPPLTPSQKSEITLVLLRLSTLYQQRESTYLKTIKPLDDDLQSTRQALDSLLKPLEKPGFDLLIQPCLDVKPSTQSQCLTYSPKPEPKPDPAKPQSQPTNPQPKKE